MSKILTAIPNNQTRESLPFKIPNGASTIYINVNADQNLTVKLFQSFDENITFDNIQTRDYLAANGDTTFNFEKLGADVIFSLENTSGTDCTFTRAFCDYKDSALPSSVSSEVSDAQTHSELSNVVAVLQAGISVNNTDFAFLSDINTTLNAGLNTSDSTTHNKLDTLIGETETITQFLQSETVNVEDISVRDRLEEVNSNINVINTTLNDGLTVNDTVSQGLLSNIDVKLNNGVIDTCSKLCRPLQVKSQFINAAGTNAVNLIDGAFKLVSFVYSHADAQGCLTFYDENAAATPPTTANTAFFSVGATASTLAAPSFPASTFINFNNGLWVRLSSNLDPNTTANDAGTVTIFYET